MFQRINKIVGNYFRKKRKPKIHTILLDSVLRFFQEQGEGIYYTCMRSGSTNIISRAIRCVTGAETHCVILYYSEELKSKFSSIEWDKIKMKYKEYYGSSYDIEEDDVKVLVMASADEVGMTYFDFSKYQRREQSIRKAPLSVMQEDTIIRYMCSDTVMDANYDYVGLTFWWFFRIIDDERAFFCSEIIEEAFKTIGIKIAAIPNPSPKDIEQYNTDTNWLKKRMGKGWPTAK